MIADVIEKNKPKRKKLNDKYKSRKINFYRSSMTKLYFEKSGFIKTNTTFKLSLDPFA